MKPARIPENYAPQVAKATQITIGEEYMDFEKNNWFYILSNTSNFDKEINHEILLLIYERENNREEEGLVIKVRTAPRRFNILKAVQFDTARLYYWNSESGAVLLMPKYKKKCGIIYIDEQECLQYAREYAQKNTIEQSATYADKEQGLTLESFFKIINSWRYYKFDNNGYCMTGESFSSDWATAFCTVFYKNNAFTIGNREILKFEVESHWCEQEAWDILSNTRKGGTWSRQELYEWIALLDTYDCKIRIWYKDEAVIKRTVLVFDGHKIKREFDVEW